MPALLIARLHQDRAYLRLIGERNRVLTEEERVPLQAFFTVLVEELHQLYPAHVPEGRRYLFLQHLAMLDTEVQTFVTTPNYLQAALNRHQLVQVALAALNFTLALYPSLT
ncbi:hypothetical protein J0X19_21965 [Hymenobacter sp. BT186]|uniref:Uncharacterized protein n=1 Tax=Hymenobacter telluris TaxID=2816474 RepID=A0A939JFP4_9BACT|nr:hypothetical protein [Hymenobacter telluris]MBO0360642.1 hypothetical protein [Hymenobacter telluris]MBW3376669.1 hypothetical protein [Hymenobacter norwichensis]